MIAVQTDFSKLTFEEHGVIVDSLFNTNVVNNVVNVVSLQKMKMIVMSWLYDVYDKKFPVRNYSCLFPPPLTLSKLDEIDNFVIYNNVSGFGDTTHRHSNVIMSVNDVSTVKDVKDIVLYITAQLIDVFLIFDQRDTELSKIQNYFQLQSAVIFQRVIDMIFNNKINCLSVEDICYIADQKLQTKFVENYINLISSMFPQKFVLQMFLIIFENKKLFFEGIKQIPHYLLEPPQESVNRFGYCFINFLQYYNSLNLSTILTTFSPYRSSIVLTTKLLDCLDGYLTGGNHSSVFNVNHDIIYFLDNSFDILDKPFILKEWKTTRLTIESEQEYFKRWTGEKNFELNQSFHQLVFHRKLINPLTRVSNTDPFSICFMKLYGSHISSITESSYLILQKVSSTLHDVIEKLDNYNFNFVMFSVLFSIVCMQKHKIVHNDLHLKNILLDDITSYEKCASRRFVYNSSYQLVKTFYFEFQNKKYYFDSSKIKFIPKIVDWEHAMCFDENNKMMSYDHHQGAYEGWYPTQYSELSDIYHLLYVSVDHIHYNTRFVKWCESIFGVSLKSFGTKYQGTSLDDFRIKYQKYSARIDTEELMKYTPGDALKILEKFATCCESNTILSCSDAVCIGRF